MAPPSSFIYMTVI